jgi:hypothetical protein
MFRKRYEIAINSTNEDVPEWRYVKGKNVDKSTATSFLEYRRHGKYLTTVANCTFHLKIAHAEEDLHNIENH